MIAVRNYTGFFVSCDEVLPYFRRAQMLAEKDCSHGCAAAAALAMPLHDFAALVERGMLPRTFYADLTGREVSFLQQGMNEEWQFDGSFSGLSELNPNSAELADIYWELHGGENVSIIPLSKQAGLWTKMPRYETADEVVNEVKEVISRMGVQLPKDFPYWKYIGTLEGTARIEK